jgi:hypothetical protein
VNVGQTQEPARTSRTLAFEKDAHIGISRARLNPRSKSAFKGDHEGEAHAFASDITCLWVVRSNQEGRVGKGLQPAKFVGPLSRRLQRIGCRAR